MKYSDWIKRGVPNIHPDKEISSEILIEVICSNLDMLRTVIENKCFSEDAIKWILDLTDPKNVFEKRNNHD